MSIDMNEELPDPTPRGEDIMVQATLADMAWILRATGSPLLLSSLVQPHLKNAAVNAEVALATRHIELVNEVRKAVEDGGLTVSVRSGLTAALVYQKWENPNEERTLEELALWELAPAGVLIHG